MFGRDVRCGSSALVGGLPVEHWSSIRFNNPQERLDNQLRRHRPSRRCRARRTERRMDRSPALHGPEILAKARLHLIDGEYPNQEVTTTAITA